MDIMRAAVHILSVHFSKMCGATQSCAKGVQLKKKGKKNECYTLRRSWKNYSLDAFLIDLVNQDWSKVIDVKTSKTRFYKLPAEETS